jgi:hypothetical protein
MSRARFLAFFDRSEAFFDGSSSRRLHFVAIGVALGLLGLLIAAPKIWLEHPYLTTLAVFSEDFRWGRPFDLIALGTVALLAAGLLQPWRRSQIAGLLALVLGLRAIWDFSLWQPFLLQFGFTAALIAYGLRASGERADRAAGLLRFALAALYTWSGFSKLHLTWLEDGLYTFWGEGWFDLSATLRMSLGLPAALFETVVGLALFTRRGRRFGLYGLILMHLFLLTMLIVRGYNPVVWPWNATMPFILLALFGGAGGAMQWRGFGALSRSVPGAVTLLLFAALPALSYAGVGSTYLSFRLYAYRYDEGFLVTSEEGRAALPADVAEEMVHQPSNGLWTLDLFYWSERELGAFVPADDFVFRRVAARIARRSSQPERLVLILRDPPTWSRRAKPQRESTWSEGRWKQR